MSHLNKCLKNLSLLYMFLVFFTVGKVPNIYIYIVILYKIHKDGVFYSVGNAVFLSMLLFHSSKASCRLKEAMFLNFCKIFCNYQIFCKKLCIYHNREITAGSALAQSCFFDKINIRTKTGNKNNRRQAK